MIDTFSYFLDIWVPGNKEILFLNWGYFASRENWCFVKKEKEKAVYVVWTSGRSGLCKSRWQRIILKWGTKQSFFCNILVCIPDSWLLRMCLFLMKWNWILNLNICFIHIVFSIWKCRQTINTWWNKWTSSIQVVENAGRRSHSSHRGIRFKWLILIFHPIQNFVPSLTLNIQYMLMLCILIVGLLDWGFLSCRKCSSCGIFNEIRKIKID